ncbi:HigA family addiction module antitoxin [Methylorubrum thiocyanatum]|uniref:HigA family addiction module antitoxin n=1 Tax=Methylorubrum thiocyanatum TaxID=47958 RepID=UPI0035C7FAD4
MTRKEAFVPQWATHSGEHLAEYIEERGWSQAEFARLAGLTPKLVSTIINGTNPVTPETALRLEHVLGLKAYIWTGLQAEWDLFQARERERESAERQADWLKQFPVKELKACGRLPDTRDIGRLFGEMLTMLGIGTAQAYDARIGSLAVHHRRARSATASPHHLYCWLMLGEEQARQRELPAYDGDRFLQSCAEIRSLTVHGPDVFEPRMLELCRSAGVALIFQKPLGRTCVFGSARWMNNERPLIQMSLRMKSNDHFWWTFFHEAAHIVLHRGKNFVDDQNGEGDGVEAEADAWAEEMLVGRERIESFATTCPSTKQEVTAFAEEVSLHPGIVLGMLQHRRVVPFSHLNELKERVAWADEVALA